MAGRRGDSSSPNRGNESVDFNFSFWKSQLKLLGYPIKEEPLDALTLKKQRVLPTDFSPESITRVFKNDFLEIAIIAAQPGSGLTRSLCTQIARQWKENRLGIRPLLIFTSKRECFAVIVPGKGLKGEAKILRLADRLYWTDKKVIESMGYVDDAQELSRSYDTVFFPYEKVRNEFFEGYRDLYQKIEKAIHTHLPKESSSYAQRFLGRLMFLYFLQRKGWLKKNKTFIDTIADYSELNTLFYVSLKEGADGIPFLNGSLFEQEEYMNAKMQSNLAPAMDPLFYEARRFFNRFNFTVDETAPLELEVSIDPALIGTVFENMLPENERGGKGTFYTPPNESSFICRRALSRYLGCNDAIDESGETFADGLEALIKKFREDRSEKEVRELRERLLSIRILDPAVGSGGFLLVMMQEIVGLIQEAEATVGWKSDVEAYKKRILTNLYGFDIEAEAVEIARLRLWLSLIIDEREPEPLPNLDMNLEVIDDSLQLPGGQRTLDEDTEPLREQLERLRAIYVNEHSSKEKKKLKHQIETLNKDIARRTGNSSSVIEMHMPNRPHVVVMNPPYVRQELIPSEKKKYYTDNYGLDKKSDLYAYFLIRAVNILSEDGVMSVITSDKWLETGYGVSLQKRLKGHLVAIFGQRERSFGADINTVISVCTARQNNSGSVDFAYLKTYGLEKVRGHHSIPKKELQPGKWFYLRAPKVFMEKILPKLTHKLGDFAEIKFGIKTGANDFFYMKDISHLYEADYLANPKKFEEWGVKARNEKELREHGLIYVENEGKEQYVLEKEYCVPVVRSPKEIMSYVTSHFATYCFSVKEKPKQFAKKYIETGKRKGFNNRPTTVNRDPWYKLPDLKPAQVIMPKSMMYVVFIPFLTEKSLCADRFYTISSKSDIAMWLFLNSVIFYMVVELYSRRLGGGALDIMVEDYEEMPVPDITSMQFSFNMDDVFQRQPMIYFEEVKQEDRKVLDREVLEHLGLKDVDEVLPSLYSGYVELVDDRLVKADRPLKKMEQETNDKDS